MTDLEQKIAALIGEHLGQTPDRSDQAVCVDLGGDCLDLIEVVMAVEDEFDISIEDTDYGDDINVEQLAALVTAKKGAA